MNLNKELNREVWKLIGNIKAEKYELLDVQCERIKELVAKGADLNLAIRRKKCSPLDLAINAGLLDVYCLIDN